MTLASRTLILSLSLLLILAAVPQAPAITITRNFLPAGTTVDVPGVGPISTTGPPATSTGDGNLMDIFNAAADVWEASILDDFNVTINVIWSDLDFLGTDTLGAAIPLVNNGAPLFRPTESLVGFNSSRDVFFLDGTPLVASEYQSFDRTRTDLGGGQMNVERRFSNSTAVASGFDLFSVALHEIGHSLGLSPFIPPYGAETLGDDDIDVTAPRPLAGSVIPTTNFLGSSPPVPPDQNAHINLSNVLMDPNLSPGERLIPTDADLLAIAQIVQFESLNLNAPSLLIPEPSSSLLLMIGGMFMLSRTRQGKTAHRS